MISFRTHVVTLVAVLLALAIGVVLGGGPLSEVGRSALTSGTPQTTTEEAATDEFGDQFAAAAAPTLYAAGLDTRSVAVVTLPGAPEATANGIVGQVEAAGGTVTATYALRQAMVDAGEKSLVDTLGSQLMTQLAQEPESSTIDAGAPTYERLGQLLGRAVASTQPTGAPADDTALSVRQSLAGAELLGAPEGEPKRAPLVLVVLGDDADDDILSGILAGLATQSVGVVAVGDTDAPDLAGLRTSPAVGDVATVDGTDTGLGRVTATLALIRSLETTGGSFGASGSDGAVPLG